MTANVTVCRERPDAGDALEWDPVDMEKAGAIVGELLGREVVFRHASGIDGVVLVVIETPGGPVVAGPGDWVVFTEQQAAAARPATARCSFCFHPTAAHDVDPDTGNRPCRSIGHPKGLACAECRRLTSREHIDAVMKMRASGDPLFGAAFSAFNTTYDHVRRELGAAYLAHFTDVHESALASALLEFTTLYRARVLRDAGRPDETEET